MVPNTRVPVLTVSCANFLCALRCYQSSLGFVLLMESANVAHDRLTSNENVSNPYATNTWKQCHASLPQLLVMWHRAGSDLLNSAIVKCALRCTPSASAAACACTDVLTLGQVQWLRVLPKYWMINNGITNNLITNKNSPCSKYRWLPTEAFIHFAFHRVSGWERLLTGFA